MAKRYYNYESQGEWEPVDRWENEGGRLEQKHDYVLDSIGDDDRRHIDVDAQIRKTGKRDDISRVRPLLPEDHQLDRASPVSRASFQSDIYAAPMRVVRLEI
jgi:hypothetical protein